MTSTSVLDGVEPIRQRATNLKVYDQVRDAIVAGRFKPGDALSTRQFADALGVSQMPVREAFHRLVAEGALENRPNRTIGLPIISVEEFEQIVEIRILLESFAAGKAAALAGETECLRLNQLVEAMERGPGTQSNRHYLRLNREFHFTVYETSGSQALVRHIEQVWLRVGPFLNWISSPSDSRIRSNQHHQAVLDAFRIRDGEAASRAITRDLKDGAEVVRARLRALDMPHEAAVRSSA